MGFYDMLQWPNGVSCCTDAFLGTTPDRGKCSQRFNIEISTVRYCSEIATVAFQTFVSFFDTSLCLHTDRFVVSLHSCDKFYRVIIIVLKTHAI